MRKALSITVCVRDDDTKTFEVHEVSDPADVLNRVALAVSAGRRIRGYMLAADEGAVERERQYLVARGYTAVTNLV